jgi:ribonuclease P protein component
MPLNPLRGWQAFRAVHATGRFRRGGFVAVHYLPNEFGFNRYGVAAKVKVGKAVTRNLVRRWTKELLRRWDAQLEQGYDIIVLAGRPDAAADYAIYAEQLAHVLSLCKLSYGPLSAS